MSIKKMTTLALYTVIALTIFVIESALPPLVPIPGIKLGLANIVTLLLLKNYSPGETFLVLIMRIVLSVFFAGQAMSLLYSLAGGLFCFVAMYAVHRFLSGKFLYVTSIIGALFHNAGQLLVAFLLTSTTAVFLYAPYLILSGAITGLFTGLCAHFTQKYLLPHMKRNI